MALVILVTTVILLGLGYSRYAGRVEREIIQPSPTRSTPARRYSDGVEFLPTPAGRLFGFQFKSITLDPIIGPIIAVQYGWLPALLWLLGGALLIGWVQNYAGLMLAVRNGGASLGALIEKFVSPRARGWLLSMVYLYLLIVLSALSVTMAPVLARENVPFAFLGLIIAGVVVAQMIHRWRLNPSLAIALSLLILFAGIYAGSQTWAQRIIRGINGLTGDPRSGVLFHRPWNYGDVTWPVFFWTLAILGFCYLGAILPLWRFAQPVNYTAGWFILLVMLASIAGIVVATFNGSVETGFDIPALVTFTQPELGPILPFLFLIVTSGAVSGWHGLVSLNSTARQLWRETDARRVAVASTFAETLLAVLALVFAATLGVSAGRYDPQHYRLVAGPAGVFAYGMARFLSGIGVSTGWGDALAVTFLATVMLTTMQLLLRMMRATGAELLGDRSAIFRGIHASTLLAVALTLFVIVSGLWQWLWVLFGSLNLLLAGVILLLISVWLARQAKPHNWTFWPAMFVSLMGFGVLGYLAIYKALLQGIILAADQSNGIIIGNFVSAAVGIYLLIAEANVFLEGIKAFNKT